MERFVLKKDGISREIIVYYQNFLGTASRRKGFLDKSAFNEQVLSFSTCKELCREVTAQIIKEAIWSINDDKSHGPNGYNSFFPRKLVCLLWVWISLRLARTILEVVLCSNKLILLLLILF